MQGKCCPLFSPRNAVKWLVEDNLWQCFGNMGKEKENSLSATTVKKKKKKKVENVKQLVAGAGVLILSVSNSVLKALSYMKRYRDLDLHN